MPPRHTYWTIIFGGQPTSFRAGTQEELLPTFRQIQARHPDAVMVWFARGRIWKSEEEAREALLRARRPRPDSSQHYPRGPRPDPSQRDPRSPRPDHSQRYPRGPRPDPSQRDPRSPRPDPSQRDPRSPRPEPNQRDPRRRERGWRPGGSHQDPRDRFKVPRDVKRARFVAKARRDRIHPRPPKKKDDE
jgi:hypothetical protein